MSVQKFFGDIVSTLNDNSVTIKFVASDTVTDGKFILDGWFNETTPEIVCAVKKPLEARVSLVGHEFCHFLQWKEQSSVWIDDDLSRVADSFLLGRRKKVTNLVVQALNATQLMELDCEKRNIELMKKYRLDFDFKRAIQRANAYVYFYSVAARVGTWYSTAPHDIREIVDAMPKRFYDIEKYREIPSSIFELYDRYCFKVRQETELYR